MVNVEEIEVDRLRENPRNPRQNDAAVDAVARSIAAFGFNNPIVTDADLLVAAGHTRLKAARKLGLKTVPVIRAPNLTGDDFTAYAIADNKTAEIAEWDQDVLRDLVVGLREEDRVDLADLGFSQAELTGLLDATGNGADKPAPDPPSEPVTQPGDLWLLGGHRLLCGDACSPADVDRLCAGVRPPLMVTDPPYGVDYDPTWRSEAAAKWAAQREGPVPNDNRLNWLPAYQLFADRGGAVSYVWHAGVYSGEIAGHLKKINFQIRNEIIWRKQHFVIGRGAYHWQHEPCWYAVRSGATAHWCGDRTQSTIWDIANANPMGGDGSGSTGHGTQKPLECMARPIRNHGGPGWVVYDPFVGSGTTIVACEQLDRVCLAMDIDPGYCDVSVRRWEELTGGQAKREAA